MNILLALVPISLLLLLVAIAAFLWAVRRGQFDDLDTPSLDILGDDERPAPRRERALADASRTASPGADTPRPADSRQDPPPAGAAGKDDAATRRDA